MYKNEGNSFVDAKSRLANCSRATILKNLRLKLKKATLYFGIL